MCFIVHIFRNYFSDICWGRQPERLEILQKVYFKVCFEDTVADRIDGNLANRQYFVLS